MTAAPDILVEIVARRRERLGVRSDVVPPPAEPTAPLSSDQAFLAALSARPGRAVIAEVKRGSPRLGSLRDRVDPEAQAKLYAAHGASALSVVVEPDFFFGSYELLDRCRKTSGLPAIAKDFVVSIEQIELAAQAGADAILLIAALYSSKELVAWASHTRRLGLVPLVETHDLEDRAKLADKDWELIGVNNRDLRTFEVDLEHSIRALPELPRNALKVAESGIGSRSDLDRLSKAGFDAFLIGESLLLAENPAEKLEELVG